MAELDLLFCEKFSGVRAWYEEKLGLIGSDIYHIA